MAVEGSSLRFMATPTMDSLLGFQNQYEFSPIEWSLNLVEQLFVTSNVKYHCDTTQMLYEAIYCSL